MEQGRRMASTEFGKDGGSLSHDDCVGVLLVHRHSERVW